MNSNNNSCANASIVAHSVIWRKCEIYAAIAASTVITSNMENINYFSSRFIVWCYPAFFNRNLAVDWPETRNCNKLKQNWKWWDVGQDESIEKNSTISKQFQCKENLPLTWKTTSIQKNIGLVGITYISVANVSYIRLYTFSINFIFFFFTVQSLIIFTAFTNYNSPTSDF